ncbi:hydroxypyruvate isomerase family protein [Oceanomicrobium pacificus]|uniref:TIM barrel protein n=1 Tax=Oceanomicrobium pacificus TaxID=2692916 RepID=A0A6B0TXN4_9RHOB|nr:TIM barrel protein [Oceanomicrobium pacificus]MXU66465.1 TIM barrel protein [Oceanomicrobium pacificus]
MPSFSANLGFLWTELSLPEAVRAAARAGFDAVEMHWPYDEDATAIRAALADTGLPLMGINTRRGPEGAFGLAAVPGQGAAARDHIDEAIAGARALGSAAVHVMAGLGEGAAARVAFEEHLAYACAQAGADGPTILIEPLNRQDVPGYFLGDFDLAGEIIAALDLPNLKLMFDSYHAGRMGLDIRRTFAICQPMVGHVQIAGVPDRGPPDISTPDQRPFLHDLDALGWDRPVGAEYRPPGRTEDSLGWMAGLRHP